jgi:hypothetical protein
MDGDLSPLSSYMQEIKASLERIGISEIGPDGGGHAFVVAFDGRGRQAGWLLSEAGRPPRAREGIEMEVLAPLVPPDLIGGAIIFGVHYHSEDEEGQSEWVPSPASWGTAAEELGGTPDLGMVIRSILDRSPAQNQVQATAPLSDAMANCFDASTSGSYASFLDEFKASRVGAIIQPAVPERSYLQDAAGNPIELGTVPTPDGRELVILFADPWEYAPRFGLQFDATIPAAGILELMKAAPSHPGVVVSSATIERSLQITPDLLRDFTV